MLLAVVAVASAYQRGGAAIGSAPGAGLPCPLSPALPAADPAVKAKRDHDQNIKDAARLSELAGEVNQDLANGADLTLSVASLKKLEEMAKLSKTLHDRMKGDNPAPSKPPRSPAGCSQNSPRK
jgi:hypothetical protein